MGGSRALGWPTRAPALRLGGWPLFLLTLPLWGLPLTVLLPLGDQARLQEAAGFPVETPELLAMRLRGLTGTFRSQGPVEPNADVPLFDLRLARSGLERLTRNLPRSAFQEERGALRWGGAFQRVKLRLRGDHSYHWFFPKRSWRLKTRKREPHLLGRKLHLINPKDGTYVGQYMASWLARRWELLSSPARMVAVNLNREFQGVYLAQPDVDESLLRRLGRLPGEIYQGDLSWRNDPRLHPMFTTPAAWRLAASSGRPPPPGEGPLVELLRRLQAGSLWEGPRPLVDPEYMARFCALVTLLNSNHYDSFHNLLLYQHPLRGQLQMIEWDSMGAARGFLVPDYQGLDVSSNLLFSELLRRPAFRARKDAFLHARLRDPAFLPALQDEVDAVWGRIEPYVARDLLDAQGQQAPAGPALLDARRRAVREFFAARADFLLERLEDARLRYAYAAGPPARLKLAAAGQAPCTDLVLRFAGPVPPTARVVQDRNRNGRRDPDDPLVPWKAAGEHALRLDETLHPGRRPAGNDFLQEYRQFLRPAPLGYLYFLEDTESELVAVEARHAFSGARVRATRGADWLERSQLSRHPWDEPPTPAPSRRVVEGPQLRLEQDWIIRPHETVLVAPGTELLLGPGVSILSYGRLELRGQPARPVRVARLDPAQAWGAVALQGEGAGGSLFQHVELAGGSCARLEGVDYLGMVNVHLARDVEFRGCSFGANSVGDDVLRAGQSELRVIDCRFRDARSDAIDFDLSGGEIRACRFEQVGNDAIDLMTSSPLIVDLRVDGAGDKGISVGEASAPLVVGADIRGAHIGIEMKDRSDPLVVSSRVEADTALHAYRKNWRYGGGGRGRFVNCQLRGRTRSVATDADSDLQLVSCVLEGPEPTGTLAQVDLSRRGVLPPTPDPLIARELGLEPGALPVGLARSGTRPRRGPLLLAQRFVHDLTTDLLGWRVEPPWAGPDPRWEKGPGGLRVEASSLGLALRLPLEPAAGAARFLGIEAQARRPCRLRVVLVQAEGERVRDLELDEQLLWRRLELPPGELRALRLELPGEHPRVLVRRVELRGAP